MYSISKDRFEFYEKRISDLSLEELKDILIKFNKITSVKHSFKNKERYEKLYIIYKYLKYKYFNPDLEKL